VSHAAHAHTARERFPMAVVTRSDERAEKREMRPTPEVMGPNEISKCPI
jgi:hypothetical protein